MYLKKEKKQREKILASSQILLLIIGIFAMGYAIGSSIGEVSAASRIFTTTDGRIVKAYVESAGLGISDEEALLDWLKENGYEIVDDANNIIQKIGENLRVTTDEKAERFDFLSRAVIPTIKLTPALKTYITEAKMTDPLKGMSPIESALENVDNGESLWQGWGKLAKGAAKEVAIAGGIYAAGQLLKSVFHAEDTKKAIDVASKAAAAGYLAGKGLAALGTSFGLSLIGGGVVAIGIFLLSYKKSDTQIITFNCNPWQAPTKGDDCEKCNNQGILPCTEYQCKSLGQACEIINAGTTEEKCDWSSRNDLEPPVIKPWEDALLDDFTYIPDNTINPPDRGAFVKYKGGCIPAFTPFTFGVTANQLASCKIDTQRKKTFNEMTYSFGGSNTFKYNHSQAITLPSPESLEAENLVLENNGNFELYVKCIDINDNPKADSASASFVFKYCVDDGPDTTPPRIIGTNILNNTPIAFSQSVIELELYVNEPAECKWTHDSDKAFSIMEGSMDCSTSITEMNTQMIYKCSTTLKGIKSREENRYYFRCKDKPLATEDRYENQEGYHFVLLGTRPLIVDDVGPQGTISGSTETVKISLTAETSAGYKEGDSTCHYSESCYKPSGSKTSFTMFYYPEATSAHSHTQDIWIKQGKYTCVIKCIDLGGNKDEKEFNYEVEIDRTRPVVIRAWHEESYLKIITNEKASCVYSTEDCDYLFEDGLLMDTIDELGHYANWDAKESYFIRCQDKYGNQPYSNDCSIIVRPFEIFER